MKPDASIGVAVARQRAALWRRGKFAAFYRDVATLAASLMLAPVFSGCSATTNQNAIVKSEFIFETAPFPSCHASTIAETKSGLVAAWFGGTAERNPDVCIYVSRNENGKWTVPMKVADGVGFATNRFPT